MDRTQEIERSIIKKYRKSIWNRFVGGIKDYHLIEEGGPHRGLHFGGQRQYAARQMHAGTAAAQLSAV